MAKKIKIFFLFIVGFVRATRRERRKRLHWRSGKVLTTFFSLELFLLN